MFGLRLAPPFVVFSIQHVADEARLGTMSRLVSLATKALPVFSGTSVNPLTLDANMAVGNSFPRRRYAPDIVIEYAIAEIGFGGQGIVGHRTGWAIFIKLPEASDEWRIRHQRESTGKTVVQPPYRALAGPGPAVINFLPFSNMNMNRLLPDGRPEWRQSAPA